MANKARAVAAGLVFASGALLAFLGHWEPAKNPGRVYSDSLAGGIPTVCNGLTRAVTDTPIIVGDTWSPEKCEAEERKALAKVQTRLLLCFREIPPQSVFDAASSFAWNLGVSAACDSLAMQAWNRGEWGLGCRRLAYSDAGKRVWSYVRTPSGMYVFVRGLANRRDAEYRTCLADVPA